MQARLNRLRHGHVFKCTATNLRNSFKAVLFKHFASCLMHSCISQFVDTSVALGKSPSYGHLS